MDIREIVKNQTEILSELEHLLDNEREILINDSASELKELIEKKKELAKKIAIVEKNRIDIYGDKTSEEFLDDGTLELDEIDGLKKLIMSIREKGETNLILTKQSLNYIRTITSALNPNKKVVTYGNSGKIGDPSTKGVFTTKV